MEEDQSRDMMGNEERVTMEGFDVQDRTFAALVGMSNARRVGQNYLK